MSDPKALQSLVQAAMDSILVHHDRAGVREHFHPDFVQHNPWADDGGAHVEAMCDITAGSSRATSSLGTRSSASTSGASRGRIVEH